MLSNNTIYDMTLFFKAPSQVYYDSLMILCEEGKEDFQLLCYDHRAMRKGFLVFISFCCAV